MAGARLSSICGVLGLSDRTIQRWRTHPESDDLRCGPKHIPANSINSSEQEEIRKLIESPRFFGVSPKQIVPILADEGIYLASESTLYRLLRKWGKEYKKPSQSRTHITRSQVIHQANGPNQVWSWDITYLPTLTRGIYLRLYLVLDVWSRKIMGWEVHEEETADHAAALIRSICELEEVEHRGLVLHSDNGKPMRGNTMIATLQWLGIVPSFSRPHVSNDNPYSESLFRTLKYTSAYPQLPFKDLSHARHWVEQFVTWYNYEHKHSGIRYVTPHQRHTGTDKLILQNRHSLYLCARANRKERWGNRSTRNWTQTGSVNLPPKPKNIVS